MNPSWFSQWTFVSRELQETDTVAVRYEFEAAYKLTSYCLPKANFCFCLYLSANGNCSRASFNRDAFNSLHSAFCSNQKIHGDGGKKKHHRKQTKRNWQIFTFVSSADLFYTYMKKLQQRMCVLLSKPAGCWINDVCLNNNVLVMICVRIMSLCPSVPHECTPT